MSTTLTPAQIRRLLRMLQRYLGSRRFYRESDRKWKLIQVHTFTKEHLEMKETLERMLAEVEGAPSPEGVRRAVGL